MLRSWIRDKSISLTIKAQNALYSAKSFLRSEKGDTNFISIMIILAIAIALAGTFIGFKDQIMELVQGRVDTLDGMNI